MRKAIPFLLIALSLSACGGKKTPWKSAIDVLNVKGDIEWMDERFFIIFEGKEIPTTGAVQYFTDKGFIANEVTYGRGNQFESRNIYQHDETGKPISAERFDEDGNMIYKVKFIYNEDTRQSMIDSYLPEGEFLTYRITRQFDSDWNDVEESISGSEGNTIMFTQKSRDEKGRVIKVKQSDGSASTEIVQEFFYDDGGVEPTSSKTLSGQDIGVENVFKYEYDAKGNWTRKEVVKNGKVVEITTRAFGYK